MPYYMLSYDIIDTKKIGNDYRPQIIAFLLDIKATNTTCRVASTIFFHWNDSIDNLEKKLESLKEDVYYHVVQIEEEKDKSGKSRPIQKLSNKKSHREKFNTQFKDAKDKLEKEKKQKK